MISDKSDEIGYIISPPGFASLQVYRVERSEPRIIYNAGGGDFSTALVDLMEYHNQCVHADCEGITNVYSGAGSERGTRHNRELRPWVFSASTSQTLLRGEKSLLEGVITLHNQVVSARLNAARIVESL